MAHQIGHDREAINVIFDGPPAPEGGRFVEVEDERGNSIKVGEWIDRGDGTWSLKIIVNDVDGGYEWCNLCNVPRPTYRTADELKLHVEATHPGYTVGRSGPVIGGW